MEMAFRTGRSCKSIARELGCSDDTVRKILKRRGVDVSQWGVKATDQQVRACQLAGMTAAAAARKLGLKTAGDWYRRWRRIAAGIPKQQGPKKP
jgi:methylphosphotriester-DNA--protein-cysteine methyltransferase